MIWDPNATCANCDPEVVSYITAEVLALCGEELQGDAQKVEELARAVNDYLGQDPNRSCVSSRHLLLLASRALSSIGEKKAACKLFIFGSGMAGPSEWQINSGQCMLMLDLKQMTLRDDDTLELTFFSALHVALDSVGEFWDESNGRGILGLRHICGTARALLGHDDPKKSAELAEEIKASCRAKLEQIRDERGWGAYPLIMNLDI